MKTNFIAKHYEVSDELERYINKKLDKLQRYTPKHARKTMHADVHLSEQQSKSTNPFECEVVLHLPHAQIVAKEATINMFAAVDIVEAKIKNQLLKYKDRAVDHKVWSPRFLNNLRRRGK